MRIGNEDTLERVWDVLLLRHGQTQGNLERRYVGSRDEGLCSQGVEALLERKGQGLYPGADLVFSSPMRRCLETALWVFGDESPVVIEEFREMRFGLFEGKNYEELQHWPDYQAWLASGGSLPFPGGEDRPGFTRRVLAGMDRVFAHLEAVRDEAAPPRVALCVHGGVIMSLLSHYDGGEYFSYLVDNGRGYACRFGGSRGRYALLSCRPLDCDGGMSLF